MRVIGTEHPHLRATQIDMDDDTEAEQLACNCWAGPTRTRPLGANGQWYTARLTPAPLRPEERRTAVADHRARWHALQIRTPGDLETMELAAFERVPPGPGEIEVAVTASSVNFADVLVRLRPVPQLRRRCTASSAWISPASSPRSVPT